MGSQPLASAMNRCAGPSASSDLDPHRQSHPKACNVQRNNDPSHGVHNGVNEAAKAAGLQGVQRLILLCRNIESGPWREDRSCGRGLDLSGPASGEKQRPGRLLLAHRGLASSLRFTRPPPSTDTHDKDQRYRQLCESWQETWSSGTWRDSPVFQRFVPLILQDREERHRLADEELLDDLWEELAADPPPFAQRLQSRTQGGS